MLNIADDYVIKYTFYTLEHVVSRRHMRIIFLLY
jgi:hypothetical protein